MYIILEGNSELHGKIQRKTISIFSSPKTADYLDSVSRSTYAFISKEDIDIW